MKHKITIDELNRQKHNYVCNYDFYNSDEFYGILDSLLKEYTIGTEGYAKNSETVLKLEIKKQAFLAMYEQFKRNYAKLVA
jgi:hypothetical protein